MLTASWEDREPPPADAEERLTSSPSCSTPRSRTRTAAISSPRPAPACSPRATRRAAASCATSTTAPSSGSSRRSHAQAGPGAHARTASERRGSRRGARAGGASNAELRELAHGILPSVLTRGGLRAGIEALVSRLELPVTSRSRPAAPAGDRGERLLRRRRGAHQRGQARAGHQRRGDGPTVDAGVRSPRGARRRHRRSRPGGHGLPGSATAWPRSAGACASTARRRRDGADRAAAAVDSVTSRLEASALDELAQVGPHVTGHGRFEDVPRKVSRRLRALDAHSTRLRRGSSFPSR